MKIIDPSVQLIDLNNPVIAMKHLEQRIRNCYKSEDLITVDSYKKLLKKVIDSHHYSTLEHITLTAKFIGSRIMSHQLVRHRHASPSQESQRYCNYSKGKFGGVQYIRNGLERHWYYRTYLWLSEQLYLYLLRRGHKPQKARAVLPNATKTEVDVTMNPRSWREFFEKRCTLHADEEIKALAEDLLRQMAERYPPLFGDLLEHAPGTNRR